MICEDCPCPHLVARDGKCFDCTGGEEPLDDEESAPSASTNSRYVTALSVLQDFYCETGYVQPNGFETWCKERLNAEKDPHCIKRRTLPAIKRPSELERRRV